MKNLSPEEKSSTQGKDPGPNLKDLSEKKESIQRRFELVTQKLNELKEASDRLLHPRKWQKKP
ncbi:hypothetical protein [Pedobacter nutrimenti]|jgi:hypothetical protein|uniref:Uncharacterized protein n=1 Tax=Pedobacter nutrimenti TaxID=1241337 RepID=A0A318UII9_9SPHI|nr:hypothetical protein [Pedobacter nutrimenti]PYF75127.1 hypothetical protein B0O44_103576 [Pedobacter nutrimenti]